ncbi:HU family DNA-binding protein [Phocaeicola barnesiae]
MLGSFVTKKRASKIARNIKANCGFVVPSHNVAVFKPCKPEFWIRNVLKN